jgi:sugar phosphate isomerase/epimerase
MTPYAVSAMLTSLPLDFGPAVRQVAELGFRHVDIVALADRPHAHLEALADSGVVVSCASVGRGLPEGQALDAPTATARRAALDEAKRQIADAARLGATHAYLVPGLDPSADALSRFAEACTLLADFAGQRMVRLCLEHIPGRALPTALGTLEWLEQVGHANLGLLLDVGHCLISQEEPAAVVRQAGARLGYVHFDDNDGTGDLHWRLLSGRLTRDSLAATLAALPLAGYRGVLALELNPQNADPLAALGEGKELLETLAPAPPVRGGA